MGRGEPEMGQSRTTRRALIPTIPPAALLPRERREWSLMCREQKKAPPPPFTLLSPSPYAHPFFYFSLLRSLALPPSVSFIPFLSWTRDTFILFVRGNERAAALFFSNNGAIFGAAEMEIYLITDTRARALRLRRSGHAVCFVRRGLRVDGILSIR